MDDKQQPSSSGIEIRYTVPDDAKYLKEWLMDPEMRSRFPMFDEVEVDDSVLRWVAFWRYKCCITAVKDGVPCGIATLYLQPYLRISHQTEFGIIVSPEYRNRGVGSLLMSSLLNLAKEKFNIELIHLQTMDDNPAIRLYKRFGFKEFGRQSHWLKNKDKTYRSRVFMERFL
jgi:RimJ/RimL family protein N-acetyltransferase